MDTAKIDQGLVPSMLDRLIDPESSGTSGRRGYSLSRMTAVLQRDIESLLNTRLAFLSVPAHFVELQRSPLTYGLPDFASIPTSTRQSQQSIGNLIEDTIARFEPRLRDVRVYLVEDADAAALVVGKTGGQGQDLLNLQFQIEARLFVDPFPDIAFETVLELSTGFVAVKAANRQS